MKNLCGKTNNSGIPTILENDVLINNPKQKATIFNNYFVSQTLLPGASSAVPPEIPLQPSGKFLSFIDVTEGEIMLLMKNVDVSKICGFDGICNKIIKFCSEGIHFNRDSDQGFQQSINCCTLYTRFIVLLKLVKRLGLFF